MKAGQRVQEIKKRLVELKKNPEDTHIQDLHEALIVIGDLHMEAMVYGPLARAIIEISESEEMSITTLEDGRFQVTLIDSFQSYFEKSLRDAVQKALVFIRSKDDEETD